MEVKKILKIHFHKYVTDIFSEQKIIFGNLTVMKGGLGKTYNCNFTGILILWLIGDGAQHGGHFNEKIELHSYVVWN